MLAQLSFAIVHDASHQFRAGGHLFALTSSFSRETEFTKFVSAKIPQSVPVTLQGGVGSRCRPTRAIVRAMTATKHEPGLSPSYRVVSYGPALEVWVLLVRLSRLSNGGLGPPDEIALSSSLCTQRSICRGAALASRLDPADSQWRQARQQQISVFCRAQRNIYSRSRTCQLLMGHGQLGLRTKNSRDISERHHLRSHELFTSRYNSTIARFPDFCNPKNPVALGHDSSFFDVTNDRLRCLCAGLPAYCHPPYGIPD